ncbi:MAG: hemerythrin domain-containing protein [Candidatus Dormibacteria bacterium]
MVTPDAEAVGNPILAELKWVHGLLRRDLKSCEALAASVTAGATASEVRDEIRRLKAKGPLFQLRMNCLRYCRFVHGHHGAEDVALFPAVRSSDPGLNTIVDRLEEDHRKVSELLDEVEASSLGLEQLGDLVARDRLTGALLQLSERLLKHLAFEEESLAPVLATWERWPVVE